MRTNIDIDEDLLREAMAATETTTKKAAVEASLREVVQLRRQGRVRKIFGIGGWEGDLASMREGTLPEWEAEKLAGQHGLSTDGADAPVR
jgi:Arc/MetJ family transcription regulator